MKPKAAIPQLRTTDLDASIRFYTEVLGFELAFRYQDFYAGVTAGPQTIHLKLVDSPDPSIPFVRDGSHVHLYIAVDDVRAAADELRQRGVRLTRDPYETPYRTREISFEDPQGHSLYLFQDL
jgi:catechol 2,3-dioxygenase-like lactoylglutathione lyase family enzyme